MPVFGDPFALNVIKRAPINKWNVCEILIHFSGDQCHGHLDIDWSFPLTKTEQYCI